MRRALATGIAILAIGGSASAIELEYAWRTGAVEHYRYEESVHWKGGPMLTVRARLAARTRSVAPDGRVALELTLEALAVSLGDKTFDLFDQVSQRALAAVCEKGRITVRDAWRLAVRDGRPAVAATDGEPLIDVPRRLLALLALPGGALRVGSEARVDHGGRMLRWRLAAVDRGAATLYVTDLVAGAPHPPARQAADLVVRFDTVRGRLLEVRGTLIWTQSTRVISRVLMQLVP